MELSHRRALKGRGSNLDRVIGFDSRSWGLTIYLQENTHVVFTMARSDCACRRSG
jgi:hypothetical protein